MLISMLYYPWLIKSIYWGYGIMEYHYKFAAGESKEEEEHLMMNRSLWDVYVPLKRIHNELTIPEHRERICLDDDDIKLWRDFFDWLFEKYGKMFKNPTLKMHMLVGTIRKQREKIQKEIEEKSTQQSLFPEEVCVEIRKLNGIN